MGYLTGEMLVGSLVDLKVDYWDGNWAFELAGVMAKLMDESKALKEVGESVAWLVAMWVDKMAMNLVEKMDPKKVVLMVGLLADWMVDALDAMMVLLWVGMMAA